MTQFRDLFDESVGATPPSSLRADMVYAAGRRRRTLVAAARSAMVVLTVIAASSAAYGAIRVTTRPTELGEGARHARVMEYAVDGEHVYAVVLDCPEPPSGGPSGTVPPATVDPTPDPGTDPSTDPTPDPTGPPPVDPTTGPPADPTAWSEPTLEPTPSLYDPCTTRLIASDDRGRHWSARTREPSHYGLTSPAPGVLATSALVYDDEPMISTDGARTWRRVTRTDTKIPRVPSGGWATTAATPGDGKVLGVNPDNAQVAPLANQPPFKVAGVTYLPGQGVIVATSYGGPLDVATDAKFAISEDNGHSWSPARTVPDTTRTSADRPDTLRMPFQHAAIATVDGTNVYLVRRGAPGTGDVVHSSIDGGATWKKRTLPDVNNVGSYVTPDGAHVVVSADDDRTSFWVSRDRGASYQRITRMVGLPRAGTFFARVLPQGDYVAQEVDAFPAPLAGRTFYQSADGWNWERIDVG